MIRLGARLAVSGGRESIVRLVLTAVGVAIGTTLLLLAAAADPAIRAHQRRVAWQFTGIDRVDVEGEGDTLQWALSDDVVAGREMTVLRVAATGPGAPVPLGLPHVPRQGEVYVSAPLARLMDELPPDRLADRFPSAPSGTLGRAHMAGPDDLVAVVGATPDDLAGVAGGRAIHHVRTRPVPFQFTDFLRAIVGIGVVGLLMPVLVFVSTSTRLGAARREQRFAALRLAGATPRQTALAAGVEAGAAAATGAALGALGYLLLRPRVAQIEIDGHPSFVGDVRVAPVVLVAVLMAVPLLAVVAAMTSLRRLRISPLGVASRAARPRPRAGRLLPLLAGTAGFLVTLRAAASAGTEMLVPVMATFALMIYGIVAAGPWLTVLTARALGRAGRRASALLAGRRLEDDPAAGFRAVSGLVLAVFVASVFSGLTPALMAEGRTGGRGLIEGATMAAGLPLGTSTASATAALDAAAAAGAGRGSVGHEDPDADLPPAAPAAGRAPTALVTCADVDVLGIPAPCPAGGTARVDPDDELALEPAPYTAAEADDMPAATVVVETDGTAATSDRVRTAIQRAVPGTVTRLGSEDASEARSRLTQVHRMVNLALTVTLVIAGCGLAVAVAGGIVERKRPFALLRLSGMHLAELRRVALLEAAAPLLLIALVSALLGLATSAVIVGLAGGGMPWRPPAAGYWLSLAGGLAAAVGVAAATLPLLGRATAPSAVRFE